MKKPLSISLIFVLILALLTGCKPKTEKISYSLIYNGNHYDGEYNGTVKDGKPDGSGTFACGKEGDDKYLIYKGQWESGQMHGKGALATNNYTVHFPKSVQGGAVSRTGTYKGYVIDSKANGKGVFSAVTDLGVSYTYTGGWKDGLFEGQGKQEYDADDMFDREGNFKKGDFYPDLPELIKSLGTMPDTCPYELSDEAYQFISDHADVFTAHDGTEMKQLTTDVPIGEFKKNPGNEEPHYIWHNSLTVTEVSESVMGSINYTQVAAHDSFDEMYVLYYIGHDQRLVTGYALDTILMPLDYSSFKNTAGSRTDAIVGVMVEIL